MTMKTMKDLNERTVKLDAAEIAYIIQRNQNNARFMRELLLRAISLDKLLCGKEAAAK